MVNDADICFQKTNNDIDGNFKVTSLQCSMFSKNYGTHHYPQMDSVACGSNKPGLNMHFCCPVRGTMKKFGFSVIHKGHISAYVLIERPVMIVRHASKFAHGY